MWTLCSARDCSWCERMSWRRVYGHNLEFGTWPQHWTVSVVRTAQNDRPCRNHLHQPRIFLGYHHHELLQYLQHLAVAISTFLQENVNIGLRCPWLVCAFMCGWIWAADFFKYSCPVNILSAFAWQCFINLLQPNGHVMHHLFNIQQLYALPTLYLCVLYLSETNSDLCHFCIHWLVFIT